METETKLMAEAERSRRLASGFTDIGVVKSLAEYAEELERRAAAIANYRSGWTAREA